MNGASINPYRIISKTELISGKLKFIPESNDNGEGYTFFYFSVIDSSNSYSDAGKITVDVDPINDAPIASVLTGTTNEDTDYSGTLFGSDVDGDELTFTLMGGGLDKGTVEIINPTTGEFTYTPFENANGQDSFDFNVSDGQEDDAATVTIIINPENDAPVFPEMPNLVVDEDNTLAIQLLATDVDGDYLTYSVEPVENIDLYIYNNQNLDSLLMVPQPDWNGTANINLTVDLTNLNRINFDSYISDIYKIID